MDAGGKRKRDTVARDVGRRETAGGDRNSIVQSIPPVNFEARVLNFVAFDIDSYAFILGPHEIQRCFKLREQT